MAVDDALLQIALLAIAFVANTFSALAGGGAGLIQFPVLIFLGLAFPVALATHKIASVALGVGATIRHWRERSLDARMALFMLVCGLPGVFAGAFIVVQIPERAGEIALGILTLALGIYSIRRPQLGQIAVDQNRDRRGQVVGGLGLFVIGILNGSLSSGTGLFVTLLLVRWFGYDYKRAVAHTLVLVGVFWNGVGATTLAMLSDVQWSWLPALVIGSLLGGYAGAHLAIVRGNLWVKRAFEVVTIAVGLLLLVG